MTIPIPNITANTKGGDAGDATSGANIFTGGGITKNSISTSQLVIGGVLVLLGLRFFKK